MRFIPYLGSTIHDAWLGDEEGNGCQQYYKEKDSNNEDGSMKLVEQCAGNAGVFRPTCISTFYFLGNAVATKVVPTLNREAWPAKYALFAFASPDQCLHSERTLIYHAGNAGVFRPTCISTFYFLGNAVATKVVPTLNREAWPAKYALFAFALLISVFIPNGPLFTSVYLWIARLGALCFVVLQQIILIDVAYNWNEDWVERATESDRLSFGSGSNWLHAIVGICVTLYTTCLVCVGVMYAHYTGDGGGGCAGNTWVITLTLLGVIAITVLQLCGTEGSLLTSGVISLYAMYLCFSIVSKNPNGDCNPELGKNDVWGITIGLLLTTVSLIWTGWSWSAVPRLSTTDTVSSAKAVMPDNSSSSSGMELNLDVPLVDGEEATTTGMVSSSSSGQTESSSLTHVWKLNIVLALISCYVAMILTGWGTVDGMDDTNHNAANPTIGRVNMAILGVAQWMALGLYGW
eukprot:CAMPEP_0170897000 /NCGR_PEP_ID=MMETSP0734-20130129/45165_1 /TAXON_ID=186038 /ORGANISM="Fragilariopsis kerguelensis, Strain L26-C5" /LENGTH=460 /DNA_ID=CAMNT_0011289421 /DNA_START=470 /DNA_END=1848 /DNA_ORIENTATION=-